MHITTNLKAVLDPEVPCTVLPVLRTDNVEQTIEETILYTRVEDGKEL